MADARVLERIKGWLDTGLIDAATAARLRADEAARVEPSARPPVPDLRLSIVEASSYLGLLLVLGEIVGLVRGAPGDRTLVVSRVGVSLSCLHVVAALVLGSLVFSHGDAPVAGVSHDRWLLIHLHLAILGWLAMLILTVGRTLAPMLAPAPVGPVARTRPPDPNARPNTPAVRERARRRAVRTALDQQRVFPPALHHQPPPAEPLPVRAHLHQAWAEPGRGCPAPASPRHVPRYPGLGPLLPAERAGVRPAARG